MKFLFIAPIPFFYERGACIRSLNMIETLSGMGHQVDVITYPVGRDIDVKNVRILRVNTRFKPPKKAKMTLQRLMTDYALYKEAVSLAGKGGYDCVIGKTPIGRFIGRKIKEKTGVPLIVDVVESTLGMIELYSRKGTFAGKYVSKIIRLFLNPVTRKVFRDIELRNYRSADVIFSNWDLVKDEVDKESGKDTMLLYDRMPDVVGAKAKRDVRKELGIKGKVLLYTGALTPQQGIDVYIDMFEHLKHKNVKLLIVGPEDQKYVDMAADKGVTNKVIFTGKVGMEEMPDYFKAADILLTAYNSGGKNATIKLLFYLFQDKPVVASDVPQYTQIVNEKIVFLARPDAVNFAKQVDFILSNPAAARKRSRRCLEYAKKRFSKDRYRRNIKLALSRISHAQ